eukprot:7425823-Pyramimonas_sp.AAC.1
MAVDNEAIESKAGQLLARSLYCCAQCFAHSMRGHHCIDHALHVKTRNSGEQHSALSAEERRVTDASVVAGALAKKAVALHPPSSPDLLERIVSACVK